MSAEQFVFLDFETTGLDPSRCRVIEIGALRMDVEGVVHDQFSCLVAYQDELPSRITELTGITDALLVQHGIPSKRAFQELLEFIGTTPCVAFNADFDRQFLEHEITRNRIAPITNEFRCALAAARDAWPVFRSHTLCALCTFFNIKGTSHRALSDASAGADVFLRAANALWSDRRVTHFLMDDFFVSRIDIENLFGCATGTKLDLWTRADRDSINAYTPQSVGGSGLALVLPKEHNASLLNKLTMDTKWRLHVDRRGHSDFSFTCEQ